MSSNGATRHYAVSDATFQALFGDLVFKLNSGTPTVNYIQRKARSLVHPSVNNFVSIKCVDEKQIT